MVSFRQFVRGTNLKSRSGRAFHIYGERSFDNHHAAEDCERENMVVSWEYQEMNMTSGNNQSFASIADANNSTTYANCLQQEITILVMIIKRR
jgi:hypothetical protein